MRHLVHIVAFIVALSATADAQPASISRRIVVDVAENPSTFTELRGRVEQKGGNEEVKLVITASVADAPLRLDRASFVTGTGPRSPELQHGRERFLNCPDPGCPEHELVSFDIDAAYLSEVVDEGEPWRVYLQEKGRTVQTLVVPVSAIADFLSRISIARRQ